MLRFTQHGGPRPSGRAAAVLVLLGVLTLAAPMVSLSLLPAAPPKVAPGSEPTPASTQPADQIAQDDNAVDRGNHREVKNNNGVVAPTPLDDAALRAALPAKPGYEWFWGPTADDAHVDGVYSSDVAITIAQDFEKALLATVSETDESIVLVNVAAFDEQKNRYDLHAHSIGGSDHLSTYCFRLDPAKLPRDRVAYLGVEVMRRDDRLSSREITPASDATEAAKAGPE